ncbi:MAG: type II toxin-antitoxin system VapC family toxin [Nitrospirae bacterium]|nr:type II toxin-antitoxin system VapC family toxin [Nitrospirota bacterium]
MIFADTSALVKYYYPEKDSEKIEGYLLSSRHLYISSLSIVEMASALMKKVRNRELKKTQEMHIWNALLDDLQTGQMEMVFLDERHYFKAADIIREFGTRRGIKTLDALQLAIAHDLGHAKLLCADELLSGLAVEMGIRLVQVA